jgi:predicted O-methyltransferase YrrM
MPRHTRQTRRTHGARVAQATLLAALSLAAFAALSLSTPLVAGEPAAPQPAAASAQATLDARVRAFLDSHKDSWHDLNVPAVDGQTLHDLIVKHHFTQALEIGTSTGHSGIWIAWALSKTGGKLTTIEIDPGRHAQALANFKAAGLADYIDARLGDAHEITRTISGPFDFVFSDADKEWYPNYLAAVWPKLRAGGCFTAHNVSMRASGITEFLDALKRLPDGTTTIDRASSAGVSITCKAAR